MRVPAALGLETRHSDFRYDDFRHPDFRHNLRAKQIGMRPAGVAGFRRSLCPRPAWLA